RQGLQQAAGVDLRAGDAQAMRSCELSGMSSLFALFRDGQLKWCSDRTQDRRSPLEGRAPIVALRSGIEWTESTWNPVTGCTKISPGCKHCYAERMAERLHAMGQENYRNGFRLTLQPHMLELP